MLSFEEVEVSPCLSNNSVSRYLIRPQFSIPPGPKAGKAIPSDNIVIKKMKIRTIYMLVNRNVLTSHHLRTD